MKVGRLGTAIAAFVIAASLAGCANREETAAPQVPTLSVRLTNFDISPSSPTIDKPGEVFLRISNDGRSPHVLAVDGPEGEAKTDTIKPGSGATLRVALSEPGRYKWYCPLENHEERGMRGHITVKDG